MIEKSKQTKTMGEISHAHPFADRGAMTRVFSRGQVATDGGEDEAEQESETQTHGSRQGRSHSDVPSEHRETMADMRHTAPKGAGDSNGVFERGHEYRVQYQ